VTYDGYMCLMGDGMGVHFTFLLRCTQTTHSLLLIAPTLLEVGREVQNVHIILVLVLVQVPSTKCARSSQRRALNVSKVRLIAQNKLSNTCTSNFEVPILVTGYRYLLLPPR